MKLLDIMKRYNKCVMRENAKLKSIYNTLIRESENANLTGECDEAEDEIKEAAPAKAAAVPAKGVIMSAKEFFGEAEGEEEAEPENEGEDIIPESEFFGEAEEAKEIEEAAEGISNEEFFAPVTECDDGKEVEEADTIQSAKKFFGEDDEEAEPENEGEELPVDETGVTLITAKEFFGEDDEEIKEGNALDKTWAGTLDKNRTDELSDSAIGKTPDEQDAEIDNAVGTELAAINAEKAAKELEESKRFAEANRRLFG